MKFLFISNIAGKRVGGFSKSSIIASKDLGIEFHIAANWSKSSPAQMKEDELKYGIRLHHINFERNPLHPSNCKAYKQLLYLIKEESFDVIHCNTPIGGILGRICGKKAKVPKIIYTVHGFHFYKGAPLINRTLFKWVEMWLAHYTDAIITINQEDYTAVSKFKLRKGGKVYYVPGVGVDASTVKDAITKRKEMLQYIGADANSILIISIGELNKNKNNQVIIRALGELQNLKIHYLLCGIGDKKDELLALAKDYNIEKNIHFLGYRIDISELLKSSDIFVMPSYREGLSRSIMEAMSAGLPCVVSNIRGNVDLIKDGRGGFLKSPDDIDGFAEAIINLSEDRELRKTMSLSNLETIKKFDINNVKKEMKKIYISILGSEISEKA